MKKTILIALVIIALGLVVFLVITTSSDEESTNTNSNSNTQAINNNNNNEKKTDCKYIYDDIECGLRSDCLAVDLCDCTTEMNRADKCGYGIPGDEICLCDDGGFLHCEELFCPTDPSVCEADYCSNFTYSNCPGACVKDCLPSECSGGICTDDCDGENSCYCS